MCVLCTWFCRQTHFSCVRKHYVRVGESAVVVVTWDYINSDGVSDRSFYAMRVCVLVQRQFVYFFHHTILRVVCNASFRCRTSLSTKCVSSFYILINSRPSQRATHTKAIYLRRAGILLSPMPYKEFKTTCGTLRNEYTLLWHVCVHFPLRLSIRIRRLANTLRCALCSRSKYQ